MSAAPNDLAERDARLQIAQALVDDRRRWVSRATFPGRVPTRLGEAYEIQRLAVELWGDEIAGWKVGRILGEEAEALGEDRFLGPVFRRSVVSAADARAAVFPVIEGGAACFEAEIVAVVGRDTPGDREAWSTAEVLPFIAGFQLGVEVAGSPVRALGDMGAAASIAAFGNNLGLLLGPRLGLTETAGLDGVVCTTSVDGLRVGEGSPQGLPGGAPAALVFAFSKAASLGRPLRAGQLVSTGALTGMHAVTGGERWTADFGRHGVISCTVEPFSRA